MKTSLKTVLFAALAAFGVPAAFAAPENHEEFARQYVPESQAIFERFRKDCAEAKKLRDALAEDLRVMNRPMGDDAGHCALCVKIDALEQREAEWAAQIKDAFFKHKAAMATSEQLAAADAALAKKSLAWENDALKPMLKKTVSQLLENWWGMVLAEIFMKILWFLIMEELEAVQNLMRVQQSLNENLCIYFYWHLYWCNKALLVAMNCAYRFLALNNFRLAQ